MKYIDDINLFKSNKDFVAEITKLAQNGVKEVTLLGQNVNSYGKDRDDD